MTEFNRSSEGQDAIPIKAVPLSDTVMWDLVNLLAWAEFNLNTMLKDPNLPYVTESLAAVDRIVSAFDMRQTVDLLRKKMEASRG